MKDKDWKNLFGSAPESFLDQVDRTLNRLEEEENMKKQYKFSTVLVAAALIAALAGVALAAGAPGLIDYLSQSRIAPVEGAQGLVESELGQLDNRYFTLNVQEAVYDEYSVGVHLVLTPHDPQTYVLFHDGMMDERPEDKQAVFFGLSVSGQSEAFELFFDSWEAEVQQDGSVDVWATGLVDGEASDHLSLTIACQYGLEVDAAQGVLPERCETSVEITSRAQRQAAKLVPVGESEAQDGAQGVQILSGLLSVSPVSGRFSVDYTCDAEDASAYVFRLFDADGHEIETGRSLWSEREQADGSVIQNRTGEVQAMESLPEKVSIEVYKADEAPLSRVDCTVVAEE